MEHGPQTPVISNVTGVKEWHAWYCNSGSLSCSALHTLYTLVDEMDKWEGAKGRIPNQKTSICLHVHVVITSGCYNLHCRDQWLPVMKELMLAEDYAICETSFRMAWLKATN